MVTFPTTTKEGDFFLPLSFCRGKKSGKKWGEEKRGKNPFFSCHAERRRVLLSYSMAFPLLSGGGGGRVDPFRLGVGDKSGHKPMKEVTIDTDFPQEKQT